MTGTMFTVQVYCLCPGLCLLVSLLHWRPVMAGPRNRNQSNAHPVTGPGLLFMSCLHSALSSAQLTAHVNLHSANQFLPAWGRERERERGECKFIVEEDILLPSHCNRWDQHNKVSGQGHLHSYTAIQYPCRDSRAELIMLIMLPSCS